MEKNILMIPTDVEAIQKFESQLKKIFAYAYIEEAENSI